MAPEDFIADIERRKGGIQKGTTTRQEEDIPVFLSGLFNEKTERGIVMDICISCGEELSIMERNRAECWECRDTSA